MTDQVLRVQAQLTSRDHTLLGWLYDHGVLTTDQIAHALFPSLDFTQRRLLTLTRLGVLARFRPNKPDGGTYPYHYVIDQLGAEVVAAQRGDDPPRRDHARSRRRHLTSKANLPHRLGVNQFFIELAGYARTHPDADLRMWWPPSRYQRTVAFVHDGQILTENHTARIRPDGHGIWTEHRRIVSFFVEYDSGTETLGKLLGKLAGYHELAQTTNGHTSPVLFWLHSAEREQHVHQRLARQRLTVPVATAARDHATQTGLSPAEHVWWLHGAATGLLRLADLATLRPGRTVNT